LEAALDHSDDVAAAVSSHAGLESFLRNNGHLFIDASLERASTTFSDLMKLVGVDTLASDVVMREIVDEVLHSEPCARRRALVKPRKGKHAAPSLVRQSSTSWEASVLVAAVQKYAEFLRTRRDAAGLQDE
jgi:hypothetical protein